MEVQQGALSLKARETASLSLKRIFEQHLHMNNCSSATAVRSSLDHLQNDNDHDQYRNQHATLNLDLDLRLAALSTSATYNEFIQHQLPHVQRINQSGNAEAGSKSSAISTTKVAQLTVFYAGTVCIFEDVPEDKARDVMLLAAGSAGEQSCVNATRKSRLSTTPVKPLTRPQAELPFARKASLTRFLKKRKDRYDFSCFFK